MKIILMMFKFLFGWASVNEWVPEVVLIKKYFKTDSNAGLPMKALEWRFIKLLDEGI